jgi:hypothetical protein
MTKTPSISILINVKSRKIIWEDFVCFENLKHISYIFSSLFWENSRINIGEESAEVLSLPLLYIIFKNNKKKRLGINTQPQREFSDAPHTGRWV